MSPRTTVDFCISSRSPRHAGREGGIDRSSTTTTKTLPWWRSLVIPSTFIIWILSALPCSGNPLTFTGRTDLGSPGDYGPATTSRGTSDGTPDGGVGRPSGVTTTFHVLPGKGGLTTMWAVTGGARPLSLGSPISGASGSTIGYHLANVGDPVVITSRLGATGGGNGSERRWFVAAIYASDQNPGPGSSSLGLTAPGFISDLGKYGLGSGPGWVAVNPTTGDWLIAAVRTEQTGSPSCGPDGRYCHSAALGSLGEYDPAWFANAINANSNQTYTITSAIPGDHPFAAYGCNSNWNYSSLPGGTCLGANLRVTVTPVGVLRGDHVGLGTAPAEGGAAAGASWSPSGMYQLYLTGVTIFP